VPQPVAIFITAREYEFLPAGALAQAGAHVKLTLSNQGTMQHDWVLKDGSGNTLYKVIAAPGQSALLEFQAPAAGVYTFICDIADHAQLGMAGKLTVR
jgi:plastocyanin